MERDVLAPNQSGLASTVRRKPLRTQHGGREHHIYAAIPKSSTIDDGGVSAGSGGDPRNVTQPFQPLELPRFDEFATGFTMEQQQSDKNATANIFEIPHLNASSSQEVSNPLMADGPHNSKAEPLQPAGTRKARKPQACSTISESILELLFAIAPLCFLVFGCLVYTRRGQPVDQNGNLRLLTAARYGPTLFPIFFAAIVGRFLRALAAFKLEHGARVLTLEYLLQSRTVFSAISAIFDLGKFHFLTPLLIILWALSPLGGQASLRVVSVGPFNTNTTHNFTYLSFVSPFTTGGVGSASAGPLVPINAAFTAFLTSSNASKAASQDIFGNVKIPILDTLPGNSDWRNVPEAEDVTWSSLTGIPVYKYPLTGVSRFTMNTGYMTTGCAVSGQDWNQTFRQSLSNLTGTSGGWSGANFAIEVGYMYSFSPTGFIFRSLAPGQNNDAPKPLTVANCTVNMNYVEVQVYCNATNCKPTAIRPSLDPANHPATKVTPSLNSSQLTPLNSLGQISTLYTSFWKNFINSTNPSASCDTATCGTSSIEGYLAKPDNPFYFKAADSSIWTAGDVLVSQRLTQLINTYWINSIGPLVISSSGDFNLTKDPNSLWQDYNTDSSIGTIETEVDVIVCNKAWLAVLLISSVVLLLNAVATAVLMNLRRGPDVLDRFSSLLRDNRYVSDPYYSSMENSFDQSRRLSRARVQLGDVQPEKEVGYAAIAVMDGVVPVQKLRPKRLYR